MTVIAAVTGSSVPSVAARPNPQCALIHDVAHDEHGAAGGLPVPPELDLLEGRAQVEAGELTVTIRVAAGQADSLTTGEQWAFRMSNKESTYSLIATRGPDGVGFSAYGGIQGANQPWLGDIQGRVDLAGGAVTMHAPLHQLGLRPTSTFTSFTLESLQGEATSGQPLRATPLTAASSPQSNSFGADHAERDAKRPLNNLCKK